MSDPKTYWEIRCNINEQILNNVVNIVATSLPHTQERLYTLLDAWDKAIKGIKVQENE